MSFKFLNESVLGINEPKKTSNELMIECITESAKVTVYQELFTESQDESFIKKMIKTVKEWVMKFIKYITSIFKRSPESNKVTSNLKKCAEAGDFKGFCDEAPTVLHKVAEKLKEDDKYSTFSIISDFAAMSTFKDEAQLEDVYENSIKLYNKINKDAKKDVLAILEDFIVSYNTCVVKHLEKRVEETNDPKDVEMVKKFIEKNMEFLKNIKK